MEIKNILVWKEPSNKKVPFNSEPPKNAENYATLKDVDNKFENRDNLKVRVIYENGKYINAWWASSHASGGDSGDEDYYAWFSEIGGDYQSVNDLFSDFFAGEDFDSLNFNELNRPRFPH